MAGGIVIDAPLERTEVVELFQTNSTPSFGQLPFARIGAVGAMFDNVPIICGGLDEDLNEEFAFESCTSFENSQWQQSYSMFTNRGLAAGVQINATTFWILGGIDGIGKPILDHTEFIIKGQTNSIPGPNLPHTLYNMCAVKRSDEEIFVIGGVHFSLEDGFIARREVWIYNPQNGFARNQGASLITGRMSHSCSTLRDGEITYIIVAGGYTGPLQYVKSRVLDSVEIYDPIENAWHSGKTNIFMHNFHTKNKAQGINKNDTYLISKKTDFPPILALQVNLCLILYNIVLWQYPLIIKGFFYLVEVLLNHFMLKTEYWNYV